MILESRVINIRVQIVSITVKSLFIITVQILLLQAVSHLSYFTYGMWGHGQDWLEWVLMGSTGTQPMDTMSNSISACLHSFMLMINDSEHEPKR